MSRTFRLVSYKSTRYKCRMATRDLELLAAGCSALGHPMRLGVLYALRTRGESSPVELANLLDADTRPVGAVAYHVRRLLGDGLVELTRTRAVRGALEHHYRVTARGCAWLQTLDSLDIRL